jgi:hypothetical protein
MPDYQQFEALRLEKGILNLSEEERASLAACIGQRIELRYYKDLRSI